jgi:protease-4
MKEFIKFTMATVTGIVITAIVGFFLLMMIIGAIIASSEKQVTVSNNSMLMLKLDNQIVDRAPDDPFADFEIPGFAMIRKMGLKDILYALDKAVDDNRIKCIYLNVSAFNGGMAAAEEIRDALAAFREKSDKPIYAYSDIYDQMSYYIASVADRIVLNPQGAIDFRGLGGEVMFYKNAFEKLGIQMQVIRHGKFKSAVEPYMLEKMSPENREQRMVYLNSMWNHLLTGISQARNIPVDSLNHLADQVMTFRRGHQALESGMVDTLLYKDQVLDELRKITGTSPKKGIPSVSVADYARIPVKKGNVTKNKLDKIAVLYASGEISPLAGDDGINGEKFSREVRKVRQDSSYKAIVLRIDSPGGSAYDSEIIWREVKLAAEEKVVVVSMSNVAASGGYYIACAANKIVAQPNTITGSIGVFGLIPNAGELLSKKLGITFDVVKTNEHSDMPSVTRPMDAFESSLMQENVEETYALFVSRVADGRKMELSAVDAIGQGRVWSGENALKIGLVDTLGGLDVAVSEAARMAGIDHYRIVSLPEMVDPFTMLMKGGSRNVRTWFLRNELGEAWPLYEQVKKVSGMKGLYTRMPYDIQIK